MCWSRIILVGVLVTTPFAPLADAARALRQDPPLEEVAPARLEPTATPSPEQVKRWLVELGDADAEKRDSARTGLMRLRRSDLDLLKRIVADSRPISPTQGIMLRDVVEHVYLKGQRYQADRGGGAFLGIVLTMITIPEGELPDPARAENVQAEGAASPPRRRVMVSDRIPGFHAYPVLRNGDIILRVVESNVRPVVDMDVSRSLAGFRPGDVVHLEIQRGGKMMRVAIQLSARPANEELIGGPPTAFASERHELANEYWTANFAKLLDT